jgi:hypothetical protein
MPVRDLDMCPYPGTRCLLKSQRTEVGNTVPSLLWIGGVAWSAQWILTVVFSAFQSGVNPISDPLLLRKSGSAGNGTQTSESVTRNSVHWTTETVLDTAFGI